MNFDFPEDVLEMRHMVQRLAERVGGTPQILAAQELDAGFAPDTWQALSELGLNSLLIDPDYQGAGLGSVAMGGLCEILGCHLLPSPFFAHAVLACDLLNRSQATTLKNRHLPAWATGEKLATLALSQPGEGWNPNAVGGRLRQDGDQWWLDGRWGQVPHGAQADEIIVAARAPNDELFLFLLLRSDLHCEPYETLDQTRRQARLSLDAFSVPESALIASGQEAENLITSCIDRATAALACEQVGLAQACVDASVSYAKTRQQFGEVIGRFQAIKHLIADMYTQLEAARSAAYYALWCADHDHSHLPLAAATAKTLATQASFHCAGQNIQIHGGIGFTWEHAAHLYFKRAQANKNLLGTEHEHLERGAQLLGLTEAV